MSEARPAAGAPEVVTVTSTATAREVTLVVHYRSGDVTYPASGQAPFDTDASGKATITFTVAQGSRDYPVIVDVTVGSPATACETNFRPTS